VINDQSREAMRNALKRIQTANTPRCSSALHDAVDRCQQDRRQSQKLSRMHLEKTRLRPRFFVWVAGSGIKLHRLRANTRRKYLSNFFTPLQGKVHERTSRRAKPGF
jgi:hypothetical protein